MKKTLVLILSILVARTTLPATSAGTNSPFGMHPASISYGMQTAQSFEAALMLKTGWHRPPVYAFHFLIQKDLGQQKYDFAMHDNLYGTVPESISILANIAPDAGDKGHGYCKKNSYEPIDEKAYFDFVKAVVERYDGDGISDMPNLKNPIKHWQVDNEPPRNLKGYAKLLEITYKAIKEADPECKVMIGGATGFPSRFEANFRRDFAPMLKELGGKYFDLFDFHWYGSIKDYSRCKKACDLVRKTLDENGFAGVPIWITEMGTYSGKPFNRETPNFQSESDQANDVFRKLLHPLGYGVDKVFLAFGMIEGFVDPKDNDYFDNTGLIYDGIGKHDRGRSVKKLAFWTYRLIADKLEGVDLAKTQMAYDRDGVKAVRFLANGKPVYACWHDWWATGGKTKKIILEGLSDGEWTVMQAVPNKESGKQLKDADYPKFFNSAKALATGGKLELEIGKSAIFISR